MFGHPKGANSAQLANLLDNPKVADATEFQNLLDHAKVESGAQLEALLGSTKINSAVELQRMLDLHGIREPLARARILGRYPESLLEAFRRSIPPLLLELAQSHEAPPLFTHRVCEDRTGKSNRR